MITLDGSAGEGGGQILRSALTLSMVTGQPFRIENIRAGRARPGLMRQHLAGVRAAAEICGAELAGADLHSTVLAFAPGTVRPGAYEFAVGSAGSTGLVLQAVLMPLALAAGRSQLVIRGGTHNSASPPFDFLDRSFLPCLARMGYRVAITLRRHGFYPAGGGEILVEIAPPRGLAPLVLTARGEAEAWSGVALVANLPPDIAQRECEVLAAVPGWEAMTVHPRTVAKAEGPGNVVMVALAFREVTEVVTGFGEKGVEAAAVAERVVREAQAYLTAGAPVGEHLADQLLLPLALGAGGRFVTGMPSLHTSTNIEVIRAFLPGVRIEIVPLGDGRHEIAVAPRAGEAA